MKIFDIGTNHGHFTDEYIKLYPDIQVICIEANPTLCSNLVNKFQNNPNISVYHYLVSQKSNEYINFYINNGCDGVSTASTNWVNNSRFNQEELWLQPIEIESITIDDLIINTFTPDMIKIDVEGYENTVIKGLTKKVNLIQFEWAEEEMESIKNTCEYLKSIGYTQFSYKFEDRPYSYIPTKYSSLEDLELFNQLIPSRKEKWGMIYAK
jgi:FkbM family methyltransferase